MRGRFRKGNQRKGEKKGTAGAGVGEGAGSGRRGFWGCEFQSALEMEGEAG